MSLEMFVATISIFYFLTGIFLWVCTWYAHNDSLTYDESFIILFLWPIVIWVVLQEGVNPIKTFRENTRMFFTLMFIQVLMIVIIISIANLIA